MNTESIGIIKRNLIKLLDASRSEGFYQARSLDTSLSDNVLHTYDNLRYFANQDRNTALIRIERILEMEEEKS
ncbi:MAG: hypothetical protein WC998_01600 [Candidatus Paceibacterota bacterium]